MYHLLLTEGATPRPITPAGFALAALGHVASMDGQRVVVLPANGAAVEFDLDGNGPRPVPGVEAGDLPLRFDRDGVHLYVQSATAVPTPIMLVDTVTGERTSWRQLSPLDAAGVFTLDFVQISADGSAYAYSIRRVVSNLQLVEGLSKIAADAGLSLAHLALAFAREHPAVTSAIIGPRTQEQLDDCLAGAEIVLSADTLDAIDALVPPGTSVNGIDPSAGGMLRRSARRRRRPR